MTELYVSLDNATFNKIDLSKDESIVMKYIYKDLQDVSKVFSPYSQNFTFGATDTNQRALLFFGNTNVLRPNINNKYYCKIYTDGVLNLTGRLQVTEGKYTNGKLETYSASFGTFMTNLKDKIGEDKISDLGSAIIDFNAKNIKDLMEAGATLNVDTGTSSIPLQTFVPFMSNMRVWSFNNNVYNSNRDNIYYFNGSSVASDKYIRHEEIRPAITLTTIIKLIEERYGLNVTAPIETREEFKKAYILCNNEVVKNCGFYTYKYPGTGVTPIHKSGFGPAALESSPKYIITHNQPSGSFKIVKNITAYDSGYDDHCTFNLRITNQAQTIPGSVTGRLRVIRKTTEEVLYLKEFNTEHGWIEEAITLSDSMFVDGVLEFYIQTSWDKLLRHKKMLWNLEYNFNQYGGSILRYYSATTFDFDDWQKSNYDSFKIDLIKTLPDTPVIDFLTSYLKLFNLQIFDTSPNNDKLFFLTPSDIDTTGFEYSKATLDYTPYLDNKTYTKKAIEGYNLYNFKHADSKYRSNVDYKTAAGVDYGQLVYPATPPLNAVEFKVETKFSIIPPVNVANTTDMLTTYGFTSDAPTVLESENLVYTQNLNELTILYRQNAIVSSGLIAVTSHINGSTQPSFVYMNNYIPAMPVNSVGNSLSFSILVINNVQFTDTLYQRGYSKQTERLLDQNTMTHVFNITLPSTEIYLNEETSVQNSGDTPSGFRLQNDIIIGETLFSIVDANIDIKTGKSILTLLNYI